MNFFVIFFLFASTLALQSRESCTDIMLGKLCLKFQKKQFSSCKRSSEVVVSQNVACITGTEYCAKIIDICAKVFDSPITTEPLPDLPPPVKEVVVPILTTTTLKPPTKEDLPPPKKDLPPPKKEVVVPVLTTTTVKPPTKRDPPPPLKEVVVPDLTTTETPATATTQFGRFLLDRFNVESPKEITMESMESRKGMFLFNQNM